MFKHLFFNYIPKPESVQSVLLVDSCSWDMVLTANRWVRSKFPDAHVDHILRQGYPQSVEGDAFKITNSATTLRLKITFVRALRAKTYDVIVHCWTNERGFNSLKILGLLAHGSAHLVYSESGEGFWVSRTGFSTFLKFCIKRRLTFLRFVLRTAGYPFSAILGFLIVIFRVIYYVLKRRLFPIIRGITQAP